MMEEVLLPFHLPENGNLLLPTHSPSNFSPFSLFHVFHFSLSLSSHFSTGEVILLPSPPPPMPLCPIQLLLTSTSLKSQLRSKSYTFPKWYFLLHFPLFLYPHFQSLLSLSFFLFLAFQFSFLLFHSRTFFPVFQADDFLED